MKLGYILKFYINNKFKVLRDNYTKQILPNFS